MLLLLMLLLVDNNKRLRTQTITLPSYLSYTVGGGGVLFVPPSDFLRVVRANAGPMSATVGCRSSGSGSNLGTKLEVYDC